LRDSVEAPVPLRLDHPLPGLPIAAYGAAQVDDFVLVTAGGRGLRWSVQALRIIGTQVINCGKEDRLAAAALAQPDEELLLLTSDGFGRRLVAEWVPFPEKPNRKGKSLIARRSPIAALANANDWTFSSEYLTAIHAGKLPLADSTKTFPLHKMAGDDQISCILANPLD
jgi:hypothetical protein